MKLTPQQHRFAENIGRGMGATDAARAAGYANQTPGALRVTVHRLQRNPEVRRVAFEEREKLLHGSAADQALCCLVGIMGDPLASDSARVSAAKFILESAGHGIENRRLLARFPNDGEKPLHQFSVAELERLVEETALRIQHFSGESIDADEVP